MRQLHPKAFWLFFLQRTFALVFFFALLILPFFISFGIFGREVSRTTRPSRYQVKEEPYSPLTIISKGVGYMQLAVLAFFVFLIVVNYIWAKLFYNSFRFELSMKGLKIERGVIWKRYVTIPYERIQNVDIYRGVFERLLGLSDLHVQTAGYSGGLLTEGRIPGLLPQDAEKLRDEFIDKIGKGQGL